VHREQGRDRSPLQERFSRLAMLLGIAFVAIAGGLFAAGLATGRDPLMMFLTATAVAVAAVPESLPVAIGVVLAIGARRILEQGGLVRRMAAAETLGSVTVIATDKTATLTIGQMRVSRLELTDGTEPQALELLAATTNAFVENPDAPAEQRRFSGSPVDQALLRAAVDAGIRPSGISERFRRIAELPFSARYKYSAALVQDTASDGATAVLLGAPEVVLKHAAGDAEQRASWTQRASALAADGFRVLAFAASPGGSRRTLERSHLPPLAFRGLIVLSDPLRPDVAEVIRTAQAAGARVIMVTGDHIGTARAIARETGILRSPERAMQGADLPADAASVIDHYDVFARVSPADKVRIVDALRSRGHTVAMLGDGVNDAPSLLRADIGVAVGSGTDVAKDASDLVLVHDGFRIIVEAIRQGRIIFDNIAKVFVFLLSDALSEVVLVSVAIIAGLPLPLLPAQILWVNIIADILPAVALAADGAERGIMQQPPRRIADLFSRRFIGMIALFGALMNVGLLALFLSLIGDGDVVYARTMVFVALGITSLFYVYSLRSLHQPIWRSNPFANRWLNGAIAVGMLMYGAAVYLPPLQRLLGTAALLPGDWGLLVAIALATVALFEGGKRFLFRIRTAHG
jgi:Ca2+-transporting ATPase